MEGRPMGVVWPMVIHLFRNYTKHRLIIFSLFYNDLEKIKIPIKVVIK